MEIRGVTRKLDDLGRIVIPSEIRKSLDIKKWWRCHILQNMWGKVGKMNEVNLSEYITEYYENLWNRNLVEMEGEDEQN